MKLHMVCFGLQSDIDYIQWGSASVPGTIVFPVAYTTHQFSTVANFASGGGTSPVTVSSRTLTGITVTSNTSGSVLYSSQGV